MKEISSLENTISRLKMHVVLIFQRSLTTLVKANLAEMHKVLLYQRGLLSHGCN